MLDLYDFFGTFSVGMAAKDLNPENPMDAWILKEIKRERLLKVILKQSGF